jgi:hypothetical protein
MENAGTVSAMTETKPCIISELMGNEKNNSNRGLPGATQSDVTPSEIVLVLSVSGMFRERERFRREWHHFLLHPSAPPEKLLDDFTISPCSSIFSLFTNTTPYP